MRLVSLSIQNFRSIKIIEELRVEPLQGFVGENNAGKSNILKAIDCFLSTGSGRITPSDFNDPARPAIVEAELVDYPTTNGTGCALT